MDCDLLLEVLTRRSAFGIWTILKYTFTDDEDGQDAGYVTLKRLRNAKKYLDQYGVPYEVLVGTE